MGTPVQPWNVPMAPTPSPSPTPAPGPGGMGGIMQLLMRLFGGGQAPAPAPTPTPSPLDPILQALELQKRQQALRTGTAPIERMVNPESYPTPPSR